MSRLPKMNSKVSYVSDGTTLIYPITFPFLQAADLVVKVNGSVVTTFITITGGLGGLGTLTFTAGHAPTNTQTIVVSSIYSQDTTNAMIRRWNDLGCPIDGPLARESQEIPTASASATVGAGATVFTNQSNQKRMVAERTEAQAGAGSSGGLAQTAGTSTPINSKA